MPRIAAKKVFMTRPAPPESDVRRLLEPHGFVVEGRSLVAFTAVPFALPASFDWVFFYSKQGVQFFFEGLAKAGITLPETTRFAAIGAGTARSLPVVHFVGDGVPETTAAAFGKVAVGKQVVFPRAANSKQSVQLLLKNEVDVLDLMVYDNMPIAEIAISDAEILIFTSPLNAQAYFVKHSLLPGQKIIAIGQTTARALSEMDLAPLAIAPQPSESALADLVLKLYHED